MVSIRIPTGDRGSVQVAWMLTSGVVALIIFVVLLVVVIAGNAGACSIGTDGVGQPSASHKANSIPADYLALYRKAGQDYGLQWNILAAVGKVESDHGRGAGPGIRSGANMAGAKGPMQFLQSTWDAYGVDGDHDGTKNVYDPADAIPGAANYLRASGAPNDWHKALYAYNHAEWYVKLVLDTARTYAQGSFHVAPGASGTNDLCQDAGGFIRPKGPDAQGNWPPEPMGPDNITPRTRRVRDLIKQRFGVPRGIGCYRNGPGAQDHALGRACDFMISSGSPSPSEANLGYSIANWATANAAELGIRYVIYRQHIWNVERNEEGWRQMGDRGGITANHYDHVHISVY